MSRSMSEHSTGATDTIGKAERPCPSAPSGAMRALRATPQVTGPERHAAAFVTTTGAAGSVDESREPGRVRGEARGPGRLRALRAALHDRTALLMLSGVLRRCQSDARPSAPAPAGPYRAGAPDVAAGRPMTAHAQSGGRFRRLTARGGLALAALLLAVVTLGGGAEEAQAQSAPLLSTTMTVGSSGTERGYSNFSSFYGSLDTATFTHSSTDYTIRRLRADSHTTQGVYLRVVPNLGESPGLVLEWAGATLPLNDATSTNTFGTNKEYHWSQTWLSTNAGSLASGSYQTTLANGSDVSVCVRTASQSCSSTSTNTAATGAPGITGAPQVGQTLTATAGDMMDGDNLPTMTFPMGYEFQWVRVDSSDNETDVGTDSQTYMPATADVGHRLKVKVSFTDGGGTTETLASEAVPAGPPDATVAAAAGACPTGNDWCGTLTSGYSLLAGGTQELHSYGYSSSLSLGTLNPATFTHGTTMYTVTHVFVSLVTSGGTVTTHSLTMDVTGGELPDGTVLNLGGTELTVGSDSENATVGREAWDLETLGISLRWFKDQKVTVSLKLPSTNTEATGKPGITGTPQVGQTLTATAGDMMDADGLPSGTFPTGYEFQWVWVVGGMDVNITGADEQTYMPATGDVGHRLKVKVSFTDGGGTKETLASEAVPAGPPGATVAAAAGACPADNDWCATVTSGYATSSNMTIALHNFGYASSTSLGMLSPTTITHGSTTYTVTDVFVLLTTPPDGNTVTAHTLSVAVTGGELPDGTVLNLGGTELTVGSDSEDATVGREAWNLKDLSISLRWFEGQKVTVSANLPPALVSAEVNGTSLVLTYGENLDTNSVPATSAYGVSVNSGTAAEPSSVAVSGKTVTLTLASAVTSGQTVTLDYTVPTSNPLRDESEIDAPGFTDRTVTNTTDTAHIPATITGVAVTSLPADDEYNLGDIMEVSVTFSKAVEVTGTPKIEVRAYVQSGSRQWFADYDATPSTSTVLVFRHTITGPNEGANTASVLPNAITLGSATIRNPGTTVDATLTYEVVDVDIPTNTRLVEDAEVTSTPRMPAEQTGNNLVFGPGDDIEITLRFGDTVTVTGTPTLEFVFPGPNLSAPYTSGSGTAALAFTLSLPDDFDDDIRLTLAANQVNGSLRTNLGLQIGSATLTDSGGRPVNPRHELIDLDTIIDTIAPELVDTPDRAVADKDRITLKYRYNEGTTREDRLNTNSVPAPEDFEVTVDSTTVAVDRVTIPDVNTVVLHLSERVAVGATVTVSYTPGTHPIEDAGGNDAAAFSNRAVRNDSVDASAGDVRLTDADGNVIDLSAHPDNVKGRLEVFHRGQWGTVCKDRFDNAYDGADTYPGTEVKKRNYAPALACRELGYANGTYWRPRNEGTNSAWPARPNSMKIWLDDVRCTVGSTHWTDNPPEHLAHCNHAGIGLNNCTHEEDAGVACSGGEPLTAEWTQLPSNHSGAGDEITLKATFSRALAVGTFPTFTGSTLFTNAGPGTIHLSGNLLTLSYWPTGTEEVRVTLPSSHRPCEEAGAMCAADGDPLSTMLFARIPYDDGSIMGRSFGATFEDVPTSHQDKPFTVRMVLSDPVNNDDDDIRDHAVKTENGTTTGAKQVPGTDNEWLLTIEPEPGKDTTVKVEPGGTCGEPGVLCTTDDETLNEMAMTTVEAPEPDPFTARFENVTGTHDGSTTFRVDLVFSEAPANVRNRDIKDAVEITGGTKKHVRPVNGDDAHRRIGIAPDGDGSVVLTLMPTTDCTDPLALCTADGRKLEGMIRLTVPGPASTPVVTPLTASFVDPPKEHKGKERLDLQIRFSEPVAGGKDAIQKTITIARGAKWGLKGLDTTGHLYRSAMRPHGFRSIVFTLAATTDCATEGALCSAAGGMLEEDLRLEIPGPAALSVADAEVDEAPDAKLAFVVSLDRARHADVTVDWTTADGTATAGSDYTADDGTLTFMPGETAKTIEVEVLDDAHDDDGETVLLKLSNPSGARIADGEATGTINNTDHIPQAWNARFARTAAEQMFEAAEHRLRTAPAAGASVTIAGLAIGPGKTSEEAEEKLDALARWADENPLEPGTRKVTGRDLLTGTRFALTTGAGELGAGTASLWGRGTISSFDGREDELTLEGEVASAMLGADVAYERWAAGAMVAHTWGEGSYAEGEHGGTVDSTITGLYPYGRYALNDRVTTWGIVGYGSGTLGLTPEGQPTIGTDIDLAMAALGLRGVVMPAPAEGGAEITLTTDALGVRTTSAAVEGDLAATEATVTRLRLGAESTWHGLKLGGGALAPRVELGLRHDGGDAETGLGLEVGGALGWSNATRGLSAEVQGRALLTHESDGFGDRGFAGSIAYDPRPRSDRGLSLTLRQSVGASATGGVDALLGQRTLAGLGAEDDDERALRRLEMRVGYGLPAFDQRFTATPELALGFSDDTRDLSAGVRLGLAKRGTVSLEAALTATRRESAGSEAPEHGVALGLNARF